MKSIDLEITALEEELKRMAPAEMPGSLLDRLSDAMDMASAEAVGVRNKVVEVPLDTELAALEKTLGDLVPHGMPENMIGRLDEAMSRWHEKVPLNEKIVPLKPTDLEEHKVSRSGFRAVAAVALMGAGAAFLTGNHEGPGEPLVQRIPVTRDGRNSPVVFTPGDARASVVSANDHGVVWPDGAHPVRCLEVKSKSEVHFRNEHGEKLIIAQPKREIMFIPVKFD